MTERDIMYLQGEEIYLLPNDIAEAKAILSELCAGPKKFDRYMSIPVNEEKDFDIILARVIRYAQKAELQIATLRAQLDAARAEPSEVEVEAVAKAVWDSGYGERESAWEALVKHADDEDEKLIAEAREEAKTAITTLLQQRRGG